MGVNGLWQVVQPCARPTNLATLNRKRLAVDASIWIYQFLKAVRDKEGNALRNSHVVGFFRRICKLLWFGIRPVFVFDGGAPALKRQTIQNRKRRREGRRDDAARTAGKLLAVQMHRMAEEEAERQRKKIAQVDQDDEPQEEIPDASKLVYVDEIGMSEQERLKTRKFHKQDAYHLPALDGGITSMGGGNDPRIMSIEELEEYARQFNNGEDINLYDFSKIDFDGDFFRSLPPVDRYNILNAARLRSRLRMGLSKEQLDTMFPDRMAFSRFQIERVKERNGLTQRLMREAGMTGLDLTLGPGGGRIAGEKDREYILVKNDGVEGGWALGVVSKEKDIGESHKPIDVDALDYQYQQPGRNADEDDDEDEFEDVPVEGLNRLPKLSAAAQVERGLQVARGLTVQRRHNNDRRREDRETDPIPDDEDSLFVGGSSGPAFPPPAAPFPVADDLFGDVRDVDTNVTTRLHPEEEADINEAIALSLKTQHGVRFDFEEDEEQSEEDKTPPPTWKQKAVEAPKPITSTSGRMVAHIVNNRSNAAVAKRRTSDVGNDSDSDSDVDLQAVLAASRKAKNSNPAPASANIKNPFDGPLPFPKLDWNPSLLQMKLKPKATTAPHGVDDTRLEPESDDELAGGFEREQQSNEARPLPPWMVDHDTDIRESLRKQVQSENRVNAEDREHAEQEQRLFHQKHDDSLIEIESSDDDDSDIEIVEVPPSPPAKLRSPERRPASANQVGEKAMSGEEQRSQGINQSAASSPEPEFEDVTLVDATNEMNIDVASQRQPPSSPEVDFEDVALTETQPELKSPSEAIAIDDTQSGLLTVEKLESDGLEPEMADDGLLLDNEIEVDEFSDPEEEELLMSMAAEAEEHARFASELNNKSEQENREAYERELRALRSQQKKDRRDADEVTQVMVAECQTLLRLFGIPYITAPMEAEAQCAELVRLSLVDGIVTDDSDTFLFGGTRVYKNMFNSNKFVECYLTDDLEKELSLSRLELISLAQLLGSDYTEGLPGVGPVTAVEILSEFPGRDGLEEFRTWWQDVQLQNRPKDSDVGSAFRRKFRKSQGAKLFLPPAFPSSAVADAYLHPEVDKSTEQFQWGIPDVEGLRQFLMATIGWSKERTDEVLVPVIKDMNRRDVEGTQSNITRYFEGSVGVGAKEAFAPRQKAKASRRMADAVNRLRAKAGGEEVPETSQTDRAAPPRKRRKNIVRTEDESDLEAPGDAEDDLDNDVEVNSSARNKSKRLRGSS